MSLVDEEDVCEARSSFSHSTTRQPRPARSRAMPQPLMPPPTISTSQSVAGRGGLEEKSLTENGPVDRDFGHGRAPLYFRVFSFGFLLTRFSSEFSLRNL